MMENKILKFRAWDLDNQEMYYSDREYDDGEWGKKWNIDAEGIWFKEMALEDTNPGGYGHVQKEVWHKPNQEIMQFTGILDKNKVEIFEGDIIKSKSSHPLEVFWMGLAWGVKWMDLGNYEETIICDDGGDMGMDEKGKMEYMEVIGNIYEQKHLLDKP